LHTVPTVECQKAALTYHIPPETSLKHPPLERWGKGVRMETTHPDPWKDGWKLGWGGDLLKVPVIPSLKMKAYNLGN